MHTTNLAPVQIPSCRMKEQPCPGDLPAPLSRLNVAGRPLKIGILSDFIRVTYANGAVFQTRGLYRRLKLAGHQVTIIGPHDPEAPASELNHHIVQVPSRPMRAYPGLHVPLPLDKALFDPHRWDFDIVFGQTTSLLIELGIWLRKMKGIPLLCVNTTHLPAAFEVLLPAWMASCTSLRSNIVRLLIRPFERLFSTIYNDSDGLIVLSDGLRDYWAQRGVRVPIHVIPRAVSADTFDSPRDCDPYSLLLRAAELPPTSLRIMCAGRHTPEKEQDRVLRVFAKHILPNVPNAVLFMLGAGPETLAYQQLSINLGVKHRVIFTGEVPFDNMPEHYRGADLFLHASRSETFGNVLGEALWCEMAVVALADGMGASSQIQDRVNGRLIWCTGRSEQQIDEAFGVATVDLLRNALARRRLGKEAGRIARLRSAPSVVDELTARAFDSARKHAQTSITRPAIQCSKWAQWATTAAHAQRWGIVMSGVYLSGQMRSSATGLPKSAHATLA